MTPIETDALVIGAGPAGLFQVFELGLLGIQAHVVDSLPQPGGQCMALYADKPIYDIPAVQVCTGRELTERLLQQIAPFHAPLHLAQEVSQLERADDGRFHLATSAGTRFIARAVFIAGGVGSFQPKRLHLDALARFDGTQLLYQCPDAAATAGRQVVVLGGGEAALDCAATLVAPGPQKAASVTLLHRRDVFQAAPETVAAVQALRDSGALTFIAGQAVGGGAALDCADGSANDSSHGSNGGPLATLDVLCADGATRTLPAELLLVFLGLSPKLGPLAGWGLALERKQLAVDTATFQTSMPGIFAVGDVNTYPGKKKLILSGFHEATLAAFGAAAYLFPERATPLQYTTTSPALQHRLGVAPDVTAADIPAAAE